MKDLSAAVAEHGADFGVAWDGDGDRIGVTDEHGLRYEADWLVALLARDLLSRHPRASVLVDLKTSLGPIQDIRAHGGRPLLSLTGFSLLRRSMQEESILFGGEASGHIFFAEDYYGIDDGVYAACALAHFLAADPRPLSAHFASIRRFVTSPEIKLPCSDHAKFRIAQAIAQHFAAGFPVLTIDGARVDFGDGWALIRGSNTNPYLSVRLEAESPPPLRRHRPAYLETPCADTRRWRCRRMCPLLCPSGREAGLPLDSEPLHGRRHPQPSDVSRL